MPYSDEILEPSSDVPATAPTLASATVRLRPVDPSDYEFLFRLSNHEALSHRWRLRNTTPSFEQFVSGLYQGIHVQFLVTDRTSGESLGLVSAYNADMRNGYAYLAMVLHPDRLSSRFGLESLLLFSNYVFQSWPFRKLYAETSELNIETFASGAGRLYEVEGHMKDHEFYAGRYWDAYLLTFERDTMSEWIARLLPDLRHDDGARD